MMLVKFKKIDSEAKLPTQNEGDVGFDLYAIEDVCIYAGMVVKVRTGVAIAGYESELGIGDAKLTVYPKIESRSGLAAKGIITLGGIVDPVYRHEIIVIMMNVAEHPKHIIKKGHRIAQIIFTPCLATPNIRLVETDDVEETKRGEGFGSSGL